MDNPSSSPEQRTLTLVVKTPNQAHPDQIVKCVDVNWTVKDLKTHLFRVYPNNPLEKDQRIIYSGKLLLDHLPIRDAFRKSDTAPIIHLVCAFRSADQLGARPKVAPAEDQRTGSPSLMTGENTATPSPLMTGENTATPSPLITGENTATPSPLMTGENTATPSPLITGANTATPSPPTGPPAEGLRHRGHPASPSPPWTSTVPGLAQMTPPTFPTYSLYSPQQLLWLQQMYARQYYIHYQAALAAAASTPMNPISTGAGPTPHPAALPNQAPIDNLPANQNAPDPQFINPGGANQDMRMNAQGGPVMEDEEDMERDWLDWVYTVARFSVFLSIVYFYSTISRFVLVMSSLLLMYLHTAGWFPFRRRNVAPAPNEPAPEVIQNHQNQNRNPGPVDALAGGDDEGADANAGAEGEAEGGAEGEGVPGEAVPLLAVLVPPHRVSLAWTAWVFFKAFFASLVPEAPQGAVN